MRSASDAVGAHMGPAGTGRPQRSGAVKRSAHAGRADGRLRGSPAHLREWPGESRTAHRIGMVAAGGAGGVRAGAGPRACAGVLRCPGAVVTGAGLDRAATVAATTETVVRGPSGPAGSSCADHDHPP